MGKGLKPTLTEIAYPHRASGPNLGLRAASSRHTEVGLKTQLLKATRLDVAAFQIASDDEIVVASSSGGRTVYTNAGRTRRWCGAGVFGPVEPWSGAHGLCLTLNASLSMPCDCSGGGTVAAGNRIPHREPKNRVCRAGLETRRAVSVSAPLWRCCTKPA